MDTKKQKLLNGYHVVFLIQSSMIGTGLLSLPGKLSSLGYSQVLFPLLFGIIASLTLWPMIWINSKFQQDNLFRIHEKLLGKWIGKIINLLLIIHFMLFLAGVIDDYMRLIQSIALPKQMIDLPVLFFLLLVIYIVKGGINTIARFCIMAFFLTLPMLYFLRWPINEGDVSHILPLFNYNGNEFLVALRQGYLSILGYELILFFYPFIQDKKNAYKHALYGIWISIFISFLIVLVSVMYFSEWQLRNVEYSVLQLLKAGELSFVERIDIFGITFWLFLILSTVSGYLWTTKQGLDYFLPKMQKYHLYIIAPVIFFTIVIPFSEEFKEKLYDISFFSAYFLIVWPIFLCIIYLFQKKKVQS